MIARPMLRLAFGAALAATAGVALSACGGDSSGEHAADDAIELPSQAELESDAAEAIDAGNADDEFERLKSEIESGS